MINLKQFFVVALLLFLFSCQEEKHEHGDKKVFSYNEASGLSTLDPAFAKDQAIIWPCMQLFNGLVQLDSSLHIVPCIAKTWDITEDGSRYTFHLRNDVFFHLDPLFGKDSSRLVTAADFIYSFNRLTDAKTASPGSWVMNAVSRDENGKVNGWSALDDTTLTLKLKAAFPPFIGLLSMPYCAVVPHEITEHYGTDFRSHPIGTGPFVFSLWKEGVRLVLLKNENYFEQTKGNKLPFLDAVEVYFITDKQSAFIEFIKGKLDFLSGLDVSYKDELLTRSGELREKYKSKFIMQTEPYLNTEYLGILMESSSSVLNDVRIRKALSYGVDRRTMMAYLRNNMGRAGENGIVPPGLPSFDSTVTGYEYNPDKAIALLKEAGFPGGKGLPEITMNTTSTYQDLSEFIKSRWENLGFKIKIDVNQAAVHRKMIAEQKLNFFRASWIADYPDAENYLSLFYSKNFAPSGPNYTHYSNPKFDRLFEKSGTETNDTIRFRLYREMDQLIMEDAPVIILYYDKVLRLYQHNIEGLGSNAMNLLDLKHVRKL